MIEANPANYVNLKLWGPQNTYTTNNLVVFKNVIYRATSNVPINAQNPSLDTARWAYVAPFIGDEVAPSESFRKLRINHNTTSLAMKAYADYVESAGILLWRGAWVPSMQYKQGHTVRHGIWGNVYSAKVEHTSTGTFNDSQWDLILDLTGITPVSEIRTSNFNAVPGMRYFVNSLGGNITINLPASPTINTRPIWITHIDGDVMSGTNNVIIARNGSNIMGFADDLQIDKNFSSFSLIYSDAAHGWRITIL